MNGMTHLAAFKKGLESRPQKTTKQKKRKLLNPTPEQG